MADQVPDLKARREALGWSVTEMASRSNTSDRTILQLEDGGTTSVEAVERIVNALDPIEKARETYAAGYITPRLLAVGTILKNEAKSPEAVRVTSEPTIKTTGKSEAKRASGH